MHFNFKDFWYSESFLGFCSYEIIRTYTHVLLYDISVTVATVAQFVQALRQVTCCIPDGVVGIFHYHSTSNHTVALELTQSSP